MPPQIAFTSMLLIVTRPVSGASESCIALTEPFDVCVVKAAHSADGAAPKRTSLPSISAMSLDVPDRLSDHTAVPAETSDIVSMVPNTSAVNFLRPVKLPTMKAMLTGIRIRASVSSRLENGVGFSSGTALFGPYQPPPLVPSCLMATIGATGPSGIFCSAICAEASTGVATGPPCSVAGTPWLVSASDQTRHSGSRKRTAGRITSAQ